MCATIRRDALSIRKLVREAEALSDEAIVAFARLKAAMIAARQNPEVEVYVGQKALMRLNQAETQALAMSTSLLRVHDELSRVARETMGGDEPVETIVPDAALKVRERERTAGGRRRHLDRTIEVEQKNWIWPTDFTCIRTFEDLLRVAVVTDPLIRQAVGRSMNADRAAWRRMAGRYRTKADALLHRGDRDTRPARRSGAC